MKKIKEDITEEELLNRYYSDGKPKWLGMILENYSLLLFGVCMKYLKDATAAKDSVQQVFVKALEEIPKGEILNLGGWLYQVAKNECLSQLRSAKKHLGADYLLQMPQSEYISIDKLLLEEKREAELIRVLNKLKEDQKECLTLFFFEHKSYQQIAKLKNISLKQVKSNIQNGKRNIKIELTDLAPKTQKKEHND